MKLAFAIFRYFPFGGLQRDMLDIAREATQRGHTVTIFCGEWSGVKPHGIDVVVTNSASIFNIAGIEHFIRGFTQVFQRNQFDLLLGFNKMPGLDVYFAGDSCFAQKAYEERGFFYRLTSRARLYLAYEKAVFGNDSKTHILSLVKKEEALFSRYYATQPQRFHLLPPGISREHIECRDVVAANNRIRRELGIDVHTKIILCLGSGFKTKGLDRSIAAFALVQKEMQVPAVLMVVGADKSQRYRKQAQQLGVADTVHFMGGRSDIGDILHTADVLLHPARRELAGNVIIEAMLCGCPVIASDICGYAHYISEQQLGDIITAPYASECIAQRVAALLAVDKNLWRDRADVFQRTGDVFSRTRRALDAVETVFQCMNTTDIIQHKGHQTLILRDEFAHYWANNQAIFSVVENLPGQVARELPDRQTVRFEWQGCGYYRKWHRGVGWGEIVKNLVRFRLPIIGAKNEWDALNTLSALAIPSLMPVAYGKRGRNPAKQQSFIVTRELTDVIQLDHFFEQTTPGFARKYLILQKVARIARELHAAGINHRDFYLCHFMLRAVSLTAANEEPDIYLVDLHRAQIRPQVPLRWLIKDMGGLYFSSLNLGFTRRDIYRFLRVYFNGQLRDIFRDKQALLLQINKRAIKTYLRDFGHLPLNT